MLKHGILFLLSLPTALFAQHDFDSLYAASAEFRDNFDAVQKAYDLFADTSLMEIAIYSDFRQMRRQKDTLHYQEAVLRYTLNDSVIVSRKIGIKARGNFRRETCSYPPIKLNFPKKTVRLKWLQTFDKIKMVGSCKPGTNYEQYLLSEYYVYRMFNQLTDHSFRVRLLRVKYYDTGKRNQKKAEQIRYAFIIEPHKAVAKRLKSKVLKGGNFPYNVFNPDEINLIAVFHYMIGNTDWSIPAQHNVKILAPKNSGSFIRMAIPYDFDFCGIVNPPYAIPSDLLPIKDITERLFRGPCRDFEQYRRTLEVFKNNRDNFFALIEDSAYLTKSRKTWMTSYLASFYEIANNPKRISQELSVNCRE